MIIHRTSFLSSLSPQDPKPLTAAFGNAVLIGQFVWWPSQRIKTPLLFLFIRWAFFWVMCEMCLPVEEWSSYDLSQLASARGSSCLTHSEVCELWNHFSPSECLGSSVHGGCVKRHTCCSGFNCSPTGERVFEVYLERPFLPMWEKEGRTECSHFTEKKENCSLEIVGCEHSSLKWP